MDTNTIRPGVLMPDGSTYYPTNVEWLIAFALAGFQWAADALADLRFATEAGDYAI
jgi:hypothetical protein